MRLLIQRVSRAAVSCGGDVVGRIGRGLLIFLGVGREDGPLQVKRMVDKSVHLRIFENEAGRFDRSLLDVNGEVLLVSQFTLYADSSKGRRPSFARAADPAPALELYELFLEELQARGIKTASGCFGERMEVELVNDGPVTIWLEDPPESANEMHEPGRKTRRGSSPG